MLIPKIESRINQYLTFLKFNRYREAVPLEFETFQTEDTYRSPPEPAVWEKIAAPYRYGKPWHCSWFRTSFHAPAGSRPLFLRVVPNTDSLAFIDGKPCGAFNPFHKKLRIEADNRDHTLHLEAYNGHYFPGCHPFEKQTVMLTLSRQIPDYPILFGGGSLVERLEPVYALYYDVRALFETAKILDANSLRKARILRALYEALGGIHFSSAGDLLEEEASVAARKLAPLLAAKNGPTTPKVYLAGHAHIDHAWLWHIGETERKTARTFMNMVRFIREYPEFIFIQSQSAQLEIIKNEYPAIFAAVKEVYQRGNWEPNGGMWVEADCNITGGESLIRQFLVGKGAVREMLGYEGDTLWLPDVFGYAAALPQILGGCGIKYFVTSKINWNDTTRFPYDTFIWRGIDGSAVKTHFIASKTQGYNGRVEPQGLAEIWGEIQHKELQGGVIKSIGEGDGGGGTSRGDLEMARRLVDLEGAPRASWTKVSAALDRIFGENTQWPEWRGELYLELHRGTYTTQAKTKQYNRRLEFALRFTEWLAGLAALEGWAPYPRDTLLGCWKKLLTHQFHDILPGSSIHRVYVEALREYQKIEAALEEINTGLIGKLPFAGKEGLLVFNDLSWERRDPVTVYALPETVRALTSPAESGEAVYLVQRYIDLEGREAAVFMPRLPSLGWASFIPAGDKAPEAGVSGPSPFTYQGGCLKTPLYQVRFDQAGRIISLIDLRQNREFVAAGGTFNSLISAQDVPVLWEAWDIDADWTTYLTEENRLLGEEIAASGPLCFRIRRNYAIGTGSVLTQDTVFYAAEPRIDFETRVNWQEERRLLKVSFDTAIDAAQIRCEVQYGHILRNTHRNLPQDRAKFEICAHKWVSLEEAGGGIALLNKAKYGHDVEGGRVRLTLLRSPTAPDEDADRGEQTFTYSLLPFADSFDRAPVVRSAYELNDPARAVFAAAVGTAAGTGNAAIPGKNPGEYSFFTVEGSAVIAEAVKAPENPGEGEKSLVIRLYESLGGRTRTTLHFSRKLAGARETDMLEGKPRTLPVSGKDLTLDFRGFEIKTILVSFEQFPKLG
ncbi:MAG: glycosyl hydrolase-related protein [Treponema sp.]|jgi:alpha-mannosidase|nr:glycosyl hydrolase-related protein [Treponema sp.]